MGNVSGIVKSGLKRTVLYDVLVRVRARRETKGRTEADRASIEAWERSGRPIPPPDAVKQRTVREYGERFGLDCFVETGTCLGAMLDAVKGCFKKIYSIELDKALFENAEIRFRPYKHIRLLQGDSSALLSMVLQDLQQPCLFWLDAHYSGGFTAKGEIETPVLKELESVFQHPTPGHAILIDDARCFTGEHDYPTIEELRRFVLARWPDAAFRVEDDIIRIHPHEAKS
jgi:hypothetical protein